MLHDVESCNDCMTATGKKRHSSFKRVCMQFDFISVCLFCISLQQVEFKSKGVKKKKVTVTVSVDGIKTTLRKKNRKRKVRR